MEVKMIDMKEIVTNPLQPRQTFDREKLQELADSIKEGELLQPIVVRTKGKKFEIVCGERRYKAFQILKEPKIPAIIREIKDDTDALEKSLIENLQRDDLTSVERENAIGELWDSDHYETETELAIKLGISVKTISNILAARDTRKEIGIAETISTRTIIDSQTLPKETQKKILKAVEEKKIEADSVRDVVRKVKEFPEPEQQMEILEEFEQQKEQSKESFDRIIQQKKEIADGLREPEHYLEEDPDKIRLNTLQEQCSNLLKMTPSNIKVYKNEKYQDDAIDILKKTMNHIQKLLIALGELDVIE